MTSIRLVARADDIGSFSGTIPAVIEGVRRGIVRNAGMMVPTPWFEDAARELRSLPGVCFGVHLTINCEWEGLRWRPVLPAARVPCLVDSDGFLKRDPLKVHQAGAVLEQLMAECQAQVDRARAMRVPVRYVDTHCGWEWIHEPSGPPRISDLMPEFCRRNGIVWANGVRFDALPQVAKPPTSAAGLVERLERARSGTYLAVTHPCLPSRSIAAERDGGIERERLDDYRLLADRDLRRELDRRGVDLISYVQAAA
jgi:predicted glycoside hydrolase/deacetylase ChbG (UPF0249 family)